MSNIKFYRNVLNEVKINTNRSKITRLKAHYWLGEISFNEFQDLAYPLLYPLA